mmetsp:Transcript_11076/g.22135  ORF Transcript_11076/g.22135 Transcript_11076/m.22135 type:complete len:218 (-) Transcript_11076:1414-2067(-)
MALTPCLNKSWWSSSGIMPPHTTIGISSSSGTRRRNSSISSGIIVRWAAACVEMPMTCTSASMACCATSLGDMNRGPMSTSNPISASPEAITLAPRSWPSRPIFPIKILGRLPCSRSKSSICVAISPALILLYIPVAMDDLASYLPHDFSNAFVISSTVARSRAARIESSNRLPFFSSKSLRHSFTRTSFLVLLTFFNRSSCVFKAFSLSIRLASTA